MGTEHTEQAPSLDVVAETADTYLVADAKESGTVDIDITEDLSDTQITELFEAFDAEDWQEVDAIIDGIELPENKAGGADRNRGGAEKLRRYWTTGPGGAKIGWNSPGDWTRCVSHLSKYLGPRAKGYCALRHKEMDGVWPNNKGKKTLITEDDGYSVKDSQSQGDVMPTDVAEAPVIEHKAVGVKGINVVDDKQGIVTTIISVTGVVDRVNDRIHPGAYEKTLAQRTPKGIWSHDWNEPVSRTLSVKELMPGDNELPPTQPNGQPWPEGAGGLQVKTQFNLETQRGREAFSDVVFFGDEQEWSIGYHVPVGGAKVDPQSGVRDIYTLDLYEYSPVLFGAMSLARTTSVKDAQTAFQTFKKSAPWMQEAGDRNIPEEAEVGPDNDGDADNSAITLSDDQMDMLRTAVSALQSLVMSCKDAGVIDDVETKAASWDQGWDSSEEESSDTASEDYEQDSEEGTTIDTEYDNLATTCTELLEGLLPGMAYRKLARVSEQFDVQMQADDPTKMRDVSRDLLDNIQSLLGESAGRDHLLRMFATEAAKFIDIKRSQESDQVDLTYLEAEPDTESEEADTESVEEDSTETSEEPADTSDSEDTTEEDDGAEQEEKDKEEKAIFSLSEIKSLEESIGDLLNAK